MSSEIIAELIRNLAAIIGAFASVITALGVLAVGYWSYQSNRQSKANALTLSDQTTSLAVVNTKVDGMSSKLVEATVAASHAEGQLQGRDEERAHNDG